MSTVAAELNRAIVHNIPISIEVNGVVQEHVDAKDMCPWHEPPQVKKKHPWRRRLMTREPHAYKIDLAHS